MTIDYSTAANLLERYARARATFDGDAFAALFAERAEYHEDPFEAPLVGHTAVRRYLLEAADVQEQVEFAIERHWVSGTTVLAAWHASYVRRPDRARVRLAGFMTLEVDADGLIERFREWWHHRESTAG
jgi:hypothetical protein